MMQYEGLCRGTPLEVERRLVRHYLHTDGAGGAGPIRYIDATDLELTEVFGTSSPSEAIRILYDGCNGDDRIARVLSEGWDGHWPDANAPGFFRYLILTCTVVALADTDRDSQEFGRNLQQLFNTTRTFSSRRALPELWTKLAAWCEIRRQQGEPIRQLDLPERGPGIHLGLTNAISFPNWRDVRHLRNELEQRVSIVQGLKDPADAARRLCSKITGDLGYSSAMVAAAREYYSFYMSQASLLHLHPFWATVCRALHSARAKPHQQAYSVRIELELAALVEDTELSISAYDPVTAEIGDPPDPYICRVEEAVKRLGAWGGDLVATTRWREAFDAGVVAFTQERFGVWSASEADPSTHDAWLYLIDAKRISALRTVPITRQRQITPDWRLVGPLRNAEAQEVHAQLNLRRRDTSESAAPPFRFEDGVRTPAGWLGRITLLPRVWRQSTGSIDLLPCDEITARPMVSDIGGGWSAIEAVEALSGSYRVRLEEGVQGAVALAVERRVQFIADSPEHPDLTSPTRRWQEDPECIPTLWANEPREVLRAETESHGHDGQPLRQFDDFLELFYARGRRGWSERDLADAIETLLPGPSPWDVMRALLEAGWAQRTIAVSWRASRWWLVAPNLVPLSSYANGPVMLGGAAPAAVRRRFVSTTMTLGGKSSVRSGVGPMSPVVTLATGVDLELLATELKWPIERPQSGHGLTAPACWPKVDTDTDRHRLHREWDWKFGRFKDLTPPRQEYPIRLTWWRRAEGDRPDLYVVEGRSKIPFTTSSRPVALAEAFRQGRQPMFKLEGEALLRIPGEGYLPLHLAKAISLLTLRCGGPVRIGNSWTYSYPTRRDGIALICSSLGRYFVKTEAVGNTPRDDLAMSSIIARARHRGGRPSRRLRGSLWT